MSETSRTYSVGLPVLVTVHDDGRVEVQVDLAELDERTLFEGCEALEPEDQPSDAQVEHDAAAIRHRLRNRDSHLTETQEV